MSQWQRRMAEAALWLVAAGILVGFAHAALVRYATFPVLQGRSHWSAASFTPEQAGEFSASSARQAYIYTRVLDAHTHLIKLATVMMLVALLAPLIALSERRKRTLAAMFVVGTILFPAGVLAEIGSPGRAPQALAAFGALLIIVAFAGLLWGLLRGTAVSAPPS